MIFPKTTEQQIDAFSRRAISNLSDSLSEQRNDLAVLIHILPRNSEGRRIAKEMLAAILLRDRAQQEFIFGNGGHQ